MTRVRLSPSFYLLFPSTTLLLAGLWCGYASCRALFAGEAEPEQPNTPLVRALTFALLYFASWLWTYPRSRSPLAVASLVLGVVSMSMGLAVIGALLIVAGVVCLIGERAYPVARRSPWAPRCHAHLPPRNELEHAHARAVCDPEYVDEFHRVLARSEVHFIHRVPDTGERLGPTTLEPGTMVEVEVLESDGAAVVPFFSSRARLSIAVAHEVFVLSVNAVDLLTLTRGATLVMNPGSDCEEWFPPERVTAVVDGAPWRSVVRAGVERAPGLEPSRPEPLRPTSTTP